MASRKKKVKRPNKKSALKALSEAPPIRKDTVTPYTGDQTENTEELPFRGTEGNLADSQRPLEELCRKLTIPAVKALEGLVRSEKTRGSTKVAAACALLDRGWGKPKDRVEITRKNDVSELSIAELEKIVADANRKEAPEPEKAIPDNVASILPK